MSIVSFPSGPRLWSGAASHESHTVSSLAGETGETGETEEEEADERGERGRGPSLASDQSVSRRLVSNSVEEEPGQGTYEESKRRLIPHISFDLSKEKEKRKKKPEQGGERERERGRETEEKKRLID